MQTWFAVSKHLLGLEGRGRIFFLICFFLIKLYDYKCKFKNMAPSQRFKKILNQMGKTHHHFFLHSMYKVQYFTCVYSNYNHSLKIHPISGKRRYNIKLWKTFTDCFNCLPVAAIVDEKIFCCHGKYYKYSILSLINV